MRAYDKEANVGSGTQKIPGETESDAEARGIIHIQWDMRFSRTKNLCFRNILFGGMNLEI